MSEPTTILVTGGAGFIGSHLIEALLKQGGNRVIALDTYFTGDEANHVAGADYVRGHTRDIDTLITDRPSIVYHLGEYSRTEKSFDEPQRVFDLNIAGTLNVVEFCRDRKSKLVYAGSSTKFADAGEGPDQSPYAWSKATNTQLVANYRKWYGLRSATAYFYNVYGGREIGHGEYATLIARYKACMRAGLPLEVRLPGNQRRNFTHVEDIVEGLLLIGADGDGDNYALGSEQSFTVREIAEMFGGPIAEAPERPGNRQFAALDPSRAAALGWKPRHSVEAHIQEFLRTLPAKTQLP